MSLRLEHLALRLDPFTLEVDVEMKAPITGLFGPSGSGKTTLLEIIAGLRQPQRGRVLLNNEVLTDMAARTRVPPELRRVGYVPQDLALFPHLDARANLYFGFRLDDKNSVLPAHVIEVLEIGPLLKRPVFGLSGGEKQRIALGRALLASPRVLLLDEPLSSLDERLKERIFPCFKAIHAEFQVPMLYVTHSRAELAALCDEVLTLEQGRLSAADRV